MASVLTGCAGEGTGAGMSANSDRAQFDRDSRNNEDASLGVKNRPDADKMKLYSEEVGLDQIDQTNRHYNESVRFAPAISQELSKMEGVEAAQVVLTDTNAYVAVKLKGSNGTATPAVYDYAITDKGGRGLFGSDAGLQINWSDTGGLPQSMNQTIAKRALDLSPPQIQRAFVTANPNFLGRVQFYGEQEKRNGSWLAYRNEFNTLVQHVFPEDANSRK
ncbi:YhcN/YlaJ family sporulation lipoprotein [Paenibacillus hamazuiensis]|uniref:YhcN/YlaJ family sporulation lipoprotein n=1 Tax=Paenibacillus hamazuiensis TaxID=2936508 RepID=UPI00200BD8BB|nr:YhcN/YlaJ family sporulation lipoprotein [Paenibacillus hamazuiensis]